MKVAIIHDWLINFGGAERVLLEIHKLFPEAPIYTCIYDEKKHEEVFFDAEIKTSFIQKLPFAVEKYRYYLPLMPIAFEQFDLNKYDLVISSSFCCAKGVNVNANTLHICYCHTPMRYAWDMYNEYCKGNILKRMIITSQLHKIRQWDRISADRVDYFIANSKYVANRIYKHYRRNSKVIYPAIRNQFYKNKIDVDTENKKDYLIVTRQVSYKKVDIVIEAFNELGLPLKVVGKGPEKSRLKKMAKNNITFLEDLTEEQLLNEYQNCRAFVFMAEEDFGMVMAEAQAMGKPVIAYEKGGASEIIINDKTGILFKEQNKDSLKDAVLKMEKEYKKFDSVEAREHAQKFNEENFKKELKEFIEEKLKEGK